jgi:hypothetical protein
MLLQHLFGLNLYIVMIVHLLSNNFELLSKIMQLKPVNVDIFVGEVVDVVLVVDFVFVVVSLAVLGEVAVDVGAILVWAKIINFYDLKSLNNFCLN